MFSFALFCQWSYSHIGAGAEGNHPDGRNVGFFDRHVEWLDEAQFQDHLKWQYAEFMEAVAAARKEGETVKLDDKRIKAFFTDVDLAEAEEE